MSKRICPKCNDPDGVWRVYLDAAVIFTVDEEDAGPGVVSVAPASADFVYCDYCGADAPEETFDWVLSRVAEGPTHYRVGDPA